MTAAVMTIYVRAGHAPQAVTDAGCGAGWTICPECGGDGDWTKFYPGPSSDGPIACVECKGTGRQLVSL